MKHTGLRMESNAELRNAELRFFGAYIIYIGNAIWAFRLAETYVLDVRRRTPDIRSLDPGLWSSQSGLKTLDSGPPDTLATTAAQGGTPDTIHGKRQPSSVWPIIP